MAFTSPITAVTGNTILDTDWNGSMRDNLKALWPFLQAGDLAYAASPTALARLAAPSVPSILKGTSAPAFSWLPLNSIVALHDKKTVDFAHDQEISGSSWVDITGAAVTLILTTTCTVIVLACITGYNTTTGDNFIYSTYVDGVIDPAAGYGSVNTTGSAARNEACPLVTYATGITSGSRIVKLVGKGGGATNHYTQGRLIALAFVEP